MHLWVFFLAKWKKKNYGPNFMIKINYLTKTKSNGKELEILFAKA